ncbi:MAG: radical SAM family heme chaperone HemW [Clostridia bacterium]|jgi:oxygen-independent coproporphyrinogen-3 oxidase|nr:radical SAM family heme chaperone HemW [Clostridia bacterium]
MKKVGLYIHIPYCVSKCTYCSFISFAGLESTMQEYLSALKKEIVLSAKKYIDIEISTIYIGGGTPSYFIKNGILEIANCIKENFKLCDDVEFTAEANPNSMTQKKAEEFVKAGINRVSLGLQTANESLLKLLGRKHSVQNFIDDIAMLKNYGITNLSADIMLGLPTQIIGDVYSTLDLLLDQNIKHISAYGLMIEEGTLLEKSIRSGLLNECNEDLAVEMYDCTFKYLKKAGFNRYEVSNFAKYGFECKHNVNYWDRGEYIGLGVAAHSFVNGLRIENTSSLNDYITAINKGEFANINTTLVNEEDAKTEYIMLKLRKTEGFFIKDYNKIFNADFVKERISAIKKLKKFDLIEINESIKVRSEKFNVLNAIILELV